MKKQVKFGLDFIRNNNGSPVSWTKSHAQKRANAMARGSSLVGAAGCTGIVADCGDYWRISIAAMPF